VERNPSSLAERLGPLAADSVVEVVAVQSAWTEQGIDLGSANIDSLEPPRVAVLADDPTEETAYGAIWFLLERRLGQPFTALRASDLGSADLHRYNAIVLPDGRAGQYRDRIGEKGLDRLARWVEDGGALVLTGGAAALAVHDKVKWSKARLLGPPVEEEEDEDGEEKDREAEEHDKEATGVAAREPGAPAASKDELETEADLRRQAARREKETELTPGAVFAADLESRHFLAYGCGDGPLPVLVASSSVFSASPSGVNVARIRRERPRLSGFAWPEAEARLRGAAYLIDEPRGRGHVILFADDPNFRNFWRGLEKLFTNAILLGPSL
jgi:hypothetical protein